jgi:hypothetical protein
MLDPLDSWFLITIILFLSQFLDLEEPFCLHLSVFIPNLSIKKQQIMVSVSKMEDWNLEYIKVKERKSIKGDSMSLHNSSKNVSIR